MSACDIVMWYAVYRLLVDTRLLFAVHLVLFLNSELQKDHSSSLDSVVSSCKDNKVCLKGIISSPLLPDGGILKTLNMSMRYNLSIHLSILH